MKRWDVINYLIEKYNYKSYLEIGCAHGVCFKRINAEHKVSVDKVFKEAMYLMTSDNFFSHHSDQKFDIIFIDGYHEKEQVIKDVNNALQVLNEGGIILMHDCNPPKFINQLPRPDKRIKNGWMGDVWKAVLHFRTTADGLQMHTIDTDCGIGVVKVGNQALYEVKDNTEVDFDYFAENRAGILNLITPKEFLKIY